MLPNILIAGMLFGGTQLAGGYNEEALKAVQELYQYSTNSVQVEPTRVNELLSSIESRLDSPQGETAQAYERVAEEARKAQPDGRELRVLARELYRAIELEQG